MKIDVHGQTLELLPERAALWVERRTLLVADPHFGKAAAFRAGGIPVPRGTTSDSLTRLDAALVRTAAERVIFLGDFLHARTGRMPGTLRRLDEWRDRRARLELVLVRGNHDARAGDPSEELGIHCIDELVEAPFHMLHHPRDSRAGYVLAGHVHPAVRLFGTARQRATLPCFHFTAGRGVLPAFGAFTGNAIVEPEADDRVFVITEGAVIEAGANGDAPVSGDAHPNGDAEADSSTARDP